MSGYCLRPCESYPYVIFDVASWARSYAHNVLSQAVTAFIIGALFGPFSRGLFLLVVFTIVYELVYYLLLGGDTLYWNLLVRFGVCCAGLLGWLVSRTLFLDEVLARGVPWDEDES